MRHKKIYINGDSNQAKTENMRDLFLYQQNGISRMTEIEGNANKKINVFNRGADISFTSTCGFLADPTGSGKTCTMLNFIKIRYKQMIKERPVVPITHSYNIFVKEHITVHNRPDELFSECTVVVVSPNITTQWSEEASSEGVSFVVINTNKHIQKCFDMIMQKQELHIVIVNENRYKAFCMASAFRSVVFARCVFDECRHMKSSSAQTLLSACFTWFISAAKSDNITADDFFNCTGGFLTYSHMMPSYMFEHIAVRTPVSEIEYPGTMEHHYYNCQKTMSRVTDIIVDELDKDLSQRLSAGDVNGALQILGAEEASDIFSVVVHRLNRDIRHVTFMIEEVQNDSRYGLNGTGSTQRLTRLEGQRQSFVRQLETAQSRFDDMLKNGSCSICLDVFTQPTMISCCSNVYCAECILSAQVLSKKCPMCRSPNFKLHRVEENGTPVNPKSFDVPEAPLSKVDVLRKIFRNESSKKVLVYSEWDSILSLLGDLSVEFKFELLHLQGFSTKRATMLCTYAKPDTRVIMFANGITDCSGLNLPQTTDIVLWHDMDTYKTQQIIGRCRRVSTSDTHHCSIHHLHRK